MRRDTNKWESSDNYDNFRQLFSTLKSMKTASRTRNALGVRMEGLTQRCRETEAQGTGSAGILPAGGWMERGREERGWAPLVPYSVTSYGSVARTNVPQTPSCKAFMNAIPSSLVNFLPQVTLRKLCAL